VPPRACHSTWELIKKKKKILYFKKQSHLESQTFKAATITQKSDELESTSALLSLSICCKSGPDMHRIEEN